MDAYAYVLEQLRRDDLQRLRAYASDGRSKFTTWLVVVARRLCLDHMRQRYGRAPQAASPGGEVRLVRRRLVDLLADDLDAAEVIADAPADNPEAQLRASELTRALETAIGALDPRDRLLLKLHFDDGLPAREVGQVMGFPTPFHVYRRLDALRRRLRDALCERGIESPEP